MEGGFRQYASKHIYDSRLLTFSFRNYRVDSTLQPAYAEVIIRPSGCWLYKNHGKGWEDMGFSRIALPVEWVWKHRKGINEMLKAREAIK